MPRQLLLCDYFNFDIGINFGMEFDLYFIDSQLTDIGDGNTTAMDILFIIL